MPVSADDKISLARDRALQNPVVVWVVGNGFEFEIWVCYASAAFEFRSNRQRISPRNSEFAARLLVQFIQKLL